MKRSGFAPRAKPLARGTAKLTTSKPLARSSGFGSVRQAAPKGAPKRIKSRGMKGRPPTADEQRFMDRAGQIPCLACLKDGRVNHHISLHHIDGRTKPGAHFQVLSLCAPHHQQDDTDPLGRVSLHGRKETFTALYGTEAELLAQLQALLA